MANQLKFGGFTSTDIAKAEEECEKVLAEAIPMQKLKELLEDKFKFTLTYIDGMKTGYDHTPEFQQKLRVENSSGLLIEIEKSFGKLQTGKRKLALELLYIIERKSWNLSFNDWEKQRGLKISGHLIDVNDQNMNPKRGQKELNMKNVLTCSNSSNSNSQKEKEDEETENVLTFEGINGTWKYYMRPKEPWLYNGTENQKGEDPLTGAIEDLLQILLLEKEARKLKEGGKFEE